jgi:hypothetical protein
VVLYSSAQGRSQANLVLEADLVLEPKPGARIDGRSLMDRIKTLLDRTNALAHSQV